MADSRWAFPLRFRDERLRELVREVAAREHVSQNDLIEQAVENEVVARGARLAEDLAQTAARLASLTEDQYQQIVERSIEDYAQGEAEPEPLQARALHSDPASAEVSGRLVPDPTLSDRLGVLAAFSAGRG